MNDNNIKGIMISQREIKIIQFADDTTIVLNGTEDSLQAAFNVLEIFGNISGLKVNTEKTQIIWIGKKKGVKDKLYINKELHWGSNNFSLHGINFSVNLKQVPSLNFELALNNIRSTLT